MSVDLPYDKIIGLVLMLGAGGWLTVSNSSTLLKWLRNRRTVVSAPGDDGHNSDAAPPEGFSDHVSLVCNTAPSAPAEVKVVYLAEGLTEAQVLVRERERLEALVAKESAE